MTTNTSETLTIHTDQGPLRLPAGSTLADAVAALLAAQGQALDCVATAVNGDFVPRAARAEYRLADGDAVLCFAPITGG